MDFAFRRFPQPVRFLCRFHSQSFFKICFTVGARRRCRRVAAGLHHGGQWDGSGMAVGWQWDGGAASWGESRTRPPTPRSTATMARRRRRSFCAEQLAERCTDDKGTDDKGAEQLACDSSGEHFAERCSARARPPTPAPTTAVAVRLLWRWSSATLAARTVCGDYSTES